VALTARLTSPSAVSSSTERPSAVVRACSSLKRLGHLPVPGLQLREEPVLLLGELVKLAAHLVHPARQGPELVAIRHRDGRAEVAFRDLAKEAFGLADREDEGPRRDEPEDEGESDRPGREAAHEEQGLTVRRLDALPEPAHPGLFVPDDPSDEAGDLPVEGSALAEVKRHRLVVFALPDEARDVRHRGQDPALDRANLLDRLALAGRGRLLQADERVVEPVLLAEDALDGGVVPEEQRIPRDAHLQA
jgi:hypothetical protein